MNVPLYTLLVCKFLVVDIILCFSTYYVTNRLRINGIEEYEKGWGSINGTRH